MVNAPYLVALVRAGTAFVNGKLVERPEDEAAGEGPAGSSLKDLDPQVLTITLWATHGPQTPRRSACEGLGVTGMGGPCPLPLQSHQEAVQPQMLPKLT